MKTKTIPVFTLFILLSIFIAACGGGSPSGNQDKLKMASVAEMPSEVQSAPLPVVEAYQFAIANPELMQHLPCYCGCGAMGHTSNYSCYVSGQDANGKPVYDTHALGCSICVDITQDAMRLSKEGKPVAEIKNYVDRTYSQYGPTNMP